MFHSHWFVRGGSKPISIGRWVFRFHFHGGVSIRLVSAAVGLVGGIKAYSCSLLCMGKRHLVAGFCSINHSSFSGDKAAFWWIVLVIWSASLSSSGGWGTTIHMLACSDSDLEARCSYELVLHSFINIMASNSLNFLTKNWDLIQLCIFHHFSHPKLLLLLASTTSYECVIRW